MSEGKAKGFREDEHDTLWFEDRVYVPNNTELRKLILQEAHDSLSWFCHGRCPKERT